MGVVGELQFDVVKHARSGGRIRRRRAPRAPQLHQLARWVEGEAGPARRTSSRQLYGYGAVDVRGNAVVLFKGEWQLETCAKAFPGTRFVELGSAGPKIEE